MVQGEAFRGDGGGFHETKGRTKQAKSLYSQELITRETYKALFTFFSSSLESRLSACNSINALDTNSNNYEDKLLIEKH